MSAPTFGTPLPDPQPALFADVQPAPERTHSTRTQYQGGQLAMCCARCFDTNGPLIRSRDGYAYCVPCARLVMLEG